jgi:hypothetical protein
MAEMFAYLTPLRYRTPQPQRRDLDEPYRREGTFLFDRLTE